MVSLHGEPCLKSFLDGFPSVFDPSWSQSCQNGFPIVQLMFLYEAGARAPRTETSAAQLGTHFGFFGARRTQKPKETYQS